MGSGARGQHQGVWKELECPECSNRPRGVQSGKGLWAREESRKVSQFLRAVHCGVGGSEDEGNASLRVRLQEGLLPADKKEMQE